MVAGDLLNHFLEHRKVCTDTRRVERGAIFFALRGERFNGNEYALKALEAGCALAVVDEDLPPHPGLYKVNNALSALQELAHAYRLRFTCPVLAITGSNGKTTTKELLRDVLRKKYRVHATQGNLNNHIGVPLTLLSAPEDSNFLIIEMGANHQREIAALSEIAAPDFGLITNVGRAHLEGFGGIEGVKKGKKELYDYLHAHGGKIFVNTDEQDLPAMARGMEIIPYSSSGDQMELKLVESAPSLSILLNTPTYSSGIVHTHFTGEYNLRNMTTAAALGLYFGVAPGDIADAIREYIPDSNRSQLRPTKNNMLIMDAYNANPTSMENALRSLGSQSNDNAFFIMGDMLELGAESPALHESMLQLAMELGLDGITVGPHFNAFSSRYPFPSFADTTAAGVYLAEHPLKKKLILIKGSRGMRLEELITAL